MKDREKHIADFRAAGIIPRESNWRGKKVYVDLRKVFIAPGVKIGDGAIIWPNVYLLGGTKIGAGCEVGPDVTIEDSLIGNNTKIKRGCEVARSQIGKGCVFNPFCYISDSSVGDNCTIWVNVSMYKAELKDSITVHRDTRLVWTRAESNCDFEAGCQMKYVAIGANCRICHSIVEGDKFDEKELARGRRSINIAHSCAIGPWVYISGRVTVNPEVIIGQADITNAFIGKRSRIYHCRISDSKIFHDAVVEEGAWIHDNSTIGPYCEVSRVEIGRSRMPNWSSSYKNNRPFIQALPRKKIKSKTP